MLLLVLVALSWSGLPLPAGAGLNIRQLHYGHRRSMHHSLLTQMAVNSTAVVPSRYASSSVGGERFISSDDMGVQRCRLFVSGSALGSELGYSGVFMLHVFLRYTTTDSISRIKGTVSAEPLAGAVLPGRLHDAQFNPHITLLTRANASLTELSGMATFPFLTVTHSAAVSPLAAEFIAPPDTEHEFYITSLGANSSCAFRPALSPNQVDYRGIDIDTTTEGAETEVKDAYVVMSPFHSMRQANNMAMFAVLLGRHIQWHRALGFTRHVVYMRAEDIMIFTTIPSVQQWVSKRHLLLVLWEVAERTDLPYYDQRIVYSHAILAFTGLHAYLAMMDLDEYVMSLRDDLATFQDMTRQCNSSAVSPAAAHRQLVSQQRSAGSADAAIYRPVGNQPQPATFLVRRYHSLAKGFYRLSPESEMWVSVPATEHPLLRYGIVNRKRPPATKGFLRPEFMPSYSARTGDVAAEPDCIFILHLKHMFNSKDKRTNNMVIRRLGFAEDFILEQALTTRARRLNEGWF